MLTHAWSPQSPFRTAWLLEFSGHINAYLKILFVLVLLSLFIQCNCLSAPPEFNYVNSSKAPSTLSFFVMSKSYKTTPHWLQCFTKCLHVELRNKGFLLHVVKYRKLLFLKKKRQIIVVLFTIHNGSQLDLIYLVFEKYALELVE